MFKKKTDKKESKVKKKKSQSENKIVEVDSSLPYTEVKEKKYYPEKRHYEPLSKEKKERPIVDVEEIETKDDNSSSTSGIKTFLIIFLVIAIFVGLGFLLFFIFSKK
ncbi:MAG: hypothetical protein J6I69_02645 [Bacilli bacterium]|nr:hypothetical protein [Bacilli bacterium]